MPTLSDEYPPKLIQSVARAVALILSKILWFIKFEGIENIPSEPGGLLVAANHATYIDPVWISIPIKRPLRYMAWDQAFNWFLIGSLIRYLGAFPVKHRAGTSKSAIAESLKALRAGATLIIFPEGEREFADGKMLEFKTGAAHVAMSAEVPILPVTIRNGNRIWPHGKKIPNFFRRVEVIYHPVVNINTPGDKEARDELSESVTEKLRQVIESGLLQVRF